MSIRIAARRPAATAAAAGRLAHRAEPPGFGLALDTPPMEARLVAELPAEGRWHYEPKWDGFRCLAYKAGDSVELRAKSGKPLGRYFPEVVDALRRLEVRRFVLDGELVIETGGRLDFDALQMRLHPAQSRIAKLAAATPARLVVFDMLVDPRGRRLLERPLAQRRTALEGVVRGVGRHPNLRLSERTLDRRKARQWLEVPRPGTDGVIVKALDAPYLPGERGMIKVKRVRTADCVVGGFRYAGESSEVGSLLLGLYDADGLLHHVGFTSSLPARDRGALTHKLEALIQPPGFTGRSPGGPSRWSTERTSVWQPLRPRLVVEVGFDHVTDGRFRHGTRILRWRTDKSPRQCTLAQIDPASRV